MNQSNLQFILKEYIDHFLFINNEKNDETFKWEAAQSFQGFNLDAEDFPTMLEKMWKASYNLIDNGQQTPFYALVTYAKADDCDAVRAMFRNLFEKEMASIEEKQAAIDSFIEESERLRLKYRPDSRLFRNDQRSVMMYLFLHDPEHNYAYKATQAKSFADCIGFYDDWGPMHSFKMDVFYKMCDQIASECRKHDALVETHKSRYENTTRHLHPDQNLHILVFDLIYSSQVYDFYNALSFDPITAEARKLYFERLALAKKLAEEEKKAQSDMDKLAQVKEDLSIALTPGTTVHHRIFGDGLVDSCDGSHMRIHFTKSDKYTSLGIAAAMASGMFRFSDNNLTERVRIAIPILQREIQIPMSLKRASEELDPYRSYLEDTKE